VPLTVYTTAGEEHLALKQRAEHTKAMSTENSVGSGVELQASCHTGLPTPFSATMTTCLYNCPSFED